MINCQTPWWFAYPALRNPGILDDIDPFTDYHIQCYCSRRRKSRSVSANCGTTDIIAGKCVKLIPPWFMLIKCINLFYFGNIVWKRKNELTCQHVRQLTPVRNCHVRYLLNYLLFILIWYTACNKKGVSKWMAASYLAVFLSTHLNVIVNKHFSNQVFKIVIS